MDDVVVIEKDGRRYALFFSHKIEAHGARFLTRHTDPLQVGVIEYAAGKASEPHRHPGAPAKVEGFSEFVYIEKGRVRVTVFDDAWTSLAEQELSAGDALLFLAGGHSVQALEDCRLIEAKQGPYPGEKNAKEYIESHGNPGQ